MIDDLLDVPKMRLGFQPLAQTTEKQFTDSCPYVYFEYRNFSERPKEAELLYPNLMIPKLIFFYIEDNHIQGVPKRMRLGFFYFIFLWGRGRLRHCKGSQEEHLTLEWLKWWGILHPINLLLL